MGLFAGIGFLLTHRLGWDWAFPVLLITGFLVAPLIPLKREPKSR